MDTMSGNVTHTMYTTGTQAWADAARRDYNNSLISFNQLTALFSGVVDPSTGKLVPQTSGWLGTFFSGLGDIGNNLASVYGRLAQIDLQRAQAEYQMNLAKYNVVSGMSGEGQYPSYGGINIFTLAAFAGVGILALVLLKSPK